MNGEFPSEISAATDSTLAYICIRINIYKNAFSFKLLEEAVIFKSLKYAVPSLARSFVHSLVSIVHTGSIFLSKKGKCPQRCSDVPNAELLITYRPIHLVNDEEKQMNEGSVSYFYKKPEFSIAYELLSPLYNFSFFR